jgi:type IV pilus assembly protein PilX
MNTATGIPKMITNSDSRGQRGAALVFSLLILLVLTILGVAALRTSTLEQMMAGNTQDQTRAFTAADTGLIRARQPANMTSAVEDFGEIVYDLPGMRARATAATPTSLMIGKVQIRSGAPEGSGTSVPKYFNQRVTGEVPTSNARAVLNQGLRGSAPLDTSSP